jgi:predicted ATPase/DNA-binding CsgD family transcriptional regulator
VTADAGTAATRSRLPAEISSFVGRRRELMQVRAGFTVSRLVTVTGIGGVGKTRVAVQAARTVGRLSPHGTCVVDLSEVDGATPVAEVVAQALGVRDQSPRRHADLLADFLRDRRLLLVLDACERHAKQCGDLADQLLRAAPGLRILATSRVPLYVAGEVVCPVTPLPVDVPGKTGADATELFRARAAALPGGELTDEDLPRVAELCRRLDGIPLAIELAAARLTVLSVPQIIARLDQRFAVLAAHHATVPHHQTLRAALDGSFELCRPAQQLLWMRLSVFAGEFDLAAVEAVCTGADLPVLDVLDQLCALVEHAVVARTAGGAVPRFRLLDTIREYGAERLEERGDTQQYRHRHRDYYATFAAHAEQAWTGPDQLEWFERLRGAHSNLRAALNAYLGDPAAGAAGADLAARLWFFWIAGGFLQEGRQYLELALARHSEPGPERRRALWAGAFVAGTQGDLDVAGALARQCLTEAIEAGDDELRASALETLGMVAAIGGELDVAVGTLTAALTLFRGLPHFDAGVLRTMPCLGITLVMRGDIDDAMTLARRSHALCRERGERWQLSYVDYLLALGLRARGEPGPATAHVRAAVETKYLFQDIVGLVMCIELLAALATEGGDGERGARLLGAAGSLWSTFGLPTFGSPFHSAEHRLCAEQTRRLLGEAAYARNLTLGQALNLDETVAYALSRAPAEPAPVTAGTTALTRRETQIAALIAEGLSNREIADRLTIAKRTADSHVEHILAKLGFRSRSQIAAWMAAAGRAHPAG